MTNDEAKAEAIRRWGAEAYAEQKRDGMLDVGIETGLPGIRALYGWGHSWEDAFALADKRGYHDQNPPERTRETGKEVSQLRLFP